MNLSISENSAELGLKAAQDICARLTAAIDANGSARLLLSTGASQFEMFQALIAQDIDWSRVAMFHLDEYVNLPETHAASFRKYLKERFISKVSLYEVNLVEAEGDVPAIISKLNSKILERPIDVGVIGIGENAHIAFNDPPADFRTRDPYIIVNLDDACKAQQVREGWFPTTDDVPKQAISMSVHRIMMSKCIISVVPHAVKARAVKDALTLSVSPDVPAAMLNMHSDWTLYLDKNSASLL